jgi:hypothetical protein
VSHIPGKEFLNEGTLTSIADASENSRGWFKGMVTDVSRFDYYPACPKCSSKLSANNWCEKCHAFKTKSNRLYLSVIIDDGSESLKLSFFGIDAERLLGLNRDEKEIFSTMRGVALADNKQFARKLAGIHGRELVVYANITQNEVTHLLEGTCIRFKSI